uniref:Uncharacterized protein LOC111128881 n=1 Tax=Crassostrea virginica TaxID=6565 RepID=A0A8B8DSJ7_CRAVI|nr:uncharacterized protein LOC111128881 [Crassostrea virginica]
MDIAYQLFSLLLLATVASVCCTFVPVVTEEKYFATSWAYNYDPSKGIAAMKKDYHKSLNDTCHVYKLTDQQRHDIHSSLGQFNIEIMMFDAILTQHGEEMTFDELERMSQRLKNFCNTQIHFLKYNFYD